MSNLDYQSLVDFRAAIRNKLAQAREKRDTAFVKGILKGRRDDYDSLVTQHAELENGLTILTGLMFQALLIDTDLDAPKDAIIKSTKNLNLTYKKIQDVEKVLSVLAEFVELISTIATSVRTGSIAKIGDILTKIDKFANSL
jgi:hypothetical protein